MMPATTPSAEKIDYLNPGVPGELPWHEVPLVRATSESLAGYGLLVDDPDHFPIEIVTWPAQGWRPVDAGTGNEAGTTKGNFRFWWEGDVLFGKNEAVQAEYLLGWSCNPGMAQRGPTPAATPPQVLLWHANYHPDGGQLFFPLDRQPFVCPLALPGDDVRPENFVAFVFDGSQGLYIHPNVWHEGIFPLVPQATFSDEQGRVHARVSCNLAREFGVFLSVRLTANGI
ncbi:MAG: ureidoglycolate lyase [Pirellulales bacterium]|nr:ureidoglycolate lyase [Pirellulales bacterium]